MSIRLEGYMQTTQQNAPLKRTMKTRHLIMLSLGGVIGTGLFLALLQIVGGDKLIIPFC